MRKEYVSDCRMVSCTVGDYGMDDTQGCAQSRRGFISIENELILAKPNPVR